MPYKESKWKVEELKAIRNTITRLLERARSSGISCKPLETALSEAGWAAALECDEEMSFMRRETEAYA